MNVGRVQDLSCPNFEALGNLREKQTAHSNGSMKFFKPAFSSGILPTDGV